MKKLGVILIAVLLFFNMTIIPGFAENEITLNADFNAEDNSFLVSGYINYDRDRIPVTLYMEQNGKAIAITKTLAKGITENGVPFTFPKVELNATTRSGDITFKVVTTFIDFFGSCIQYYSGIDIKFQALYDINTALKNNDTETLTSQIISSANVLGINGEAFSNLSDNASRIALDYLKLLNISIQENFTNIEECYDTEEECNAISDEIEKYQKHYKEAIALASFFDNESTAQLKEWYDTYKDTYGFLTDDETTVVDEETLLSYFDEAILSEGYLLRLDNISYVTNLKELNLQMKNQAVLQKVQDSNPNTVRRIIDNLPDLLVNVMNQAGDATVSLNYADWETIKLTENTGDVCVEIAGKNYTSLYDFVLDLNSKIQNVKSSIIYIPQTPTGQGSRPDSGSGGSGKGTAKPIAIPTESIKPAANTMVFSDIAHVSWAREAISYLYTEGIIAGRDKSTFAPDDNVTRAELLKMLVTGFKLKGVNNAEFVDVPHNAWYAEYVGIGQSNNIINGDADGNFNPNKPVSRQDATVMMYRVLNASFNDNEANFKDYNEISAYAKDAVSYMYSNGIIDGVGDGKFAPKANLTRAQAAKMIYKLLTK